MEKSKTESAQEKTLVQDGDDNKIKMAVSSFQ